MLFQLFTVNTNIMDFTVIDHLLILLCWMVCICVVHVMLLFLRDITNTVVPVICTVAKTIGTITAIIYFNIVGVILGILFVSLMCPFLVVSALICKGVNPVVNWLWMIGQSIGRCVDTAIYLTGLLPHLLWDLTIDRVKVDPVGSKNPVGEYDQYPEVDVAM